MNEAPRDGESHDRKHARRQMDTAVQAGVGVPRYGMHRRNRRANP
jgi:hypothetical protein